MKRLILLVPMLMFMLIFSGCSTADNQGNINTAQKNISTSSSSNEKDTIKIEDEDLSEILKKKKLTMVNVWATFCSPCIKEMPHLAEISSEYADKDFQIVGIVIDALDEKDKVSDEQIALAKEIIEETGANYKHILPNSDLPKDFLSDVSVVPTTFFFDSEGNQVGDAVLGSKSKTEWIKEIDDRLETLDKEKTV
ncbi:Thiol-disulfide oxidoreductase ResA [bioreactor metagenome]|uniref:Thiol-disulfide oxidoreductase ResA n=1 Tax=bioreactor metagenome TaxID=1076179 RepID=A0A645H1C8_9ZZZZ|nr:TlpA disulfide reductase family protein [Lachnospiraceae bacterium]